MLATGIKGQCVLILGAEADTATETILGNICINSSGSIKARQIAIFKYINSTLARFRILEVTVYRRRVQSGSLTGTEFQIQVGTRTFAG